MISDPIPQKLAPRHRPMKREQVVYLIFLSEMLNSPDNDGSVRATPCNQRLVYGKLEPQGN
jgi:hypothetical protein